MLVDGTAVATFHPDADTFRYYTTPAFTVAAGDHTVTFAGLDSAGGDNSALLDGLDIIPATAGVPAVDDPSFEQAPLGDGSHAYNPYDPYRDFEGSAGVSLP